MKKLYSLISFLNKAGLVNHALGISNLIKNSQELNAPSLASNQAFIDDEGRIFAAIRLPKSNDIRIFYTSTGTGTPGLAQSGEWIPMNGMAFVMDGGSPSVYYIKDEGKIPKEGTEEYDAKKHLETNGWEKGPNQYLKINTKFISDKESLSDEDKMQNKIVFHHMSAFNDWMSRIGAKENYPRFTRPGNGPGRVSYDDFMILFGKYFP